MLEELLSSIRVEQYGDVITIYGLYNRVLLEDLKRVYDYDPEKGTHFMELMSTGFLVRTSNITFHKFFALEVYSLFERLHKLTSRSSYKTIMNRLIEISETLRNHLAPIIPLPGSIASRVDKLSIPLFPYQKAFLIAYYNAKHKLKLNGYILAFDQGLGKTFTAIATVYAFQMFPTIVTAPKSVLPSWYESVLKIIPGLQEEEVLWIGEHENTKPWKICITNYERLSQVMSYTRSSDGPVQCMLLDESHNFRYLDTNRVENLLNIRNSLGINNIIAMSGTPIKALASELIPILRLIDPEFTSDVEKIFRRMYNSKSYTFMTGYVLRNRVALYMERRMKEGTIELPNKYYHVIKCDISDITPYLIDVVKENVKKYVSDNAPEYKKLVSVHYKMLSDHLLTNKINDISSTDISLYFKAIDAYMSGSGELEASKIVIANFEEKLLKNIEVKKTGHELVSLRKKCTSYIPILLGKAMGIYFSRNKINMLIDIVDSNIEDFIKIIKAAKKKTIIFSTALDPIKRVTQLLNDKGIGTIMGTGETDNKTNIKIFRDDPNIQVLAGTIQAVGTGTTMVCANTMIFLNVPYRDADYLQAQDRIYRVGQDTECFYYRCVVNDKRMNILNNENLIREWSEKMTRIALEGLAEK